ncbi:MAG: ATP-binding cassette domain-containing protein [Candidatus Aenigmarchaeota archaeon]|nr:ATP-binding cassette domain-containing protein [Candidatus Aenigmarchaeota archaeon]
MPERSIIKVINLKKHYKDVKAVDGVSFDVKKGEIFGFLGPNGAGKTTTIKMLVTLLRPTSGTAKIVGKDIQRNSDDVRNNIGIVFQEPALDEKLTGRENLDFHARMYGMKKEQRQKRIKEVIKLVDLEEKANVLVKKYSGGMKRRLEIARGLMHFPKVLFLDEPTIGLDPQTRRSIWKYIKTLNEREKITIFLTTHYMEEADYLCNRVAIIDQGKILVSGIPSKLKAKIGKDVINVECTNADVFYSAFKKFRWVDTIKLHDSTVTIGAKNIEKRLPQIIKFAEKNKVKVNSIDIRKPTLEDIFIYYTGRKMRDGEGNNSPTIRGRFMHR